MNTEGQISRPPSGRQLAIYLGAALLAASIVMILFVLPAEFRIDPTGFGALTGLNHLAGAKPTTITVPPGNTTPAQSVAVRDYPMPFRSDVIDIPLAAAGDTAHGDELEYKVRMKAGDSFVYSWSTPDVQNAEELYYDFHGETPAADKNTEATVVEYRQATGTHSNGVMIAPIGGVHGWYLQNQSLKRAVVHLKLSGFYELIPPGEYGNQAGITANRPADH